jgi:membrane peptidoglycan carboxypeptidase
VDVAAPDASTLLIAEIRDVDGQVLYRAAPTRELVAPIAVAAMTTDVLEHVVTSGTGRRAHEQVQLGGSMLPLAGKTGTTNNFRNAAFLGVAPVIDGGGLRVGRNIVIGTYVGYDDNRPMVSGRIKLAGASGALPAWILTARGLAAVGMLGPLDTEAPEAGWTRDVPGGLVHGAVDTLTGLCVDEHREGTVAVLTREKPPVLAAVDNLGHHVRVVPRRVAPSTLHADKFLGGRDALLRHAETRRGLWAPFRRERADKSQDRQP